MLSAENRETVRLYWDEFINKKSLALAERIFASSFLLYDPLSPSPVGRDVFVGMLTELFSSFPDAHYTAEEEFAESSKLAIRWTMRATHQGPFLGIAPTGKTVSMSGVDMLYLAAGMIEALRVEADLLGLAHQLGAVPALDLSC
jgi:predicted ester cyclase